MAVPPGISSAHNNFYTVGHDPILGAHQDQEPIEYIACSLPEPNLPVVSLTPLPEETAPLVTLDRGEDIQSSSWRNIASKATVRNITSFAGNMLMRGGYGALGSLGKKWQKWKLSEENWGKFSDYVPDIIKNKLTLHYSGKVKEALKATADSNRQTIYNKLTDPENFKKCETIIVDYTVSFIISKKDSINKGLGPNAFERYKFHDPELIRGFLLRIFMGSLPEGDQKISTEDLLTSGVVELLSGIQNLSDIIENQLKFERYIRNRQGVIDDKTNANLQKEVQNLVEIFLSKYFPNKEKEFGSWFGTGLVRGRLWATLSEGMTAIYYSFEKMKVQKPELIPSTSPLLTHLDSAPIVNEFVGSSAEHVMAFIKSAFKDTETVEDLLQGLKGVVCSENFQENHPDTLKATVKNIFTSKDPKVRQLFTRGLGYLEHIIFNLINHEAKQIEYSIEPEVLEGDRDDFFSILIEKVLISIVGDIYNLFNAIKTQSTSINFENVLKKESLTFLEKKFPNKFRDFPPIFRFFLGGNEKAWDIFVEKFTSIVFKFYRPIYEQPIIFEEYKEKLRLKIHNEEDPEATPVNIQRAIDVSQGIANDIFDGIFQKLTKTTKDEDGNIIPVETEEEFDEIEKLLGLLKPDDEPDLPESHPFQFLKGIKYFLLSKNPQAVNVQNSLKTYLGQLVFKAGVNLVHEADNDPDNPCPKHLLVAKGFRHLLSLLCVNTDMTELHHYILKKEKPLSENPHELKKSIEERFLKRRKFIYGEKGEPPRLVNNLLKTLFPDLPRHLPLIPTLNKKLCSKIESDLLPDYIISNYEKSSRWIRELPENEDYILNYVSEGPQEKRDFGQRILDNCTVVSQFILDLVPNLFETDPDAFGNILHQMLSEYLPPMKDPENFVRFLSSNFKVLGNSKDRAIIETQSCLKNYVYAACVKFYVLALKKVEKIDGISGNFTVTELVNMCLGEFYNYIHPLNIALNEYNSRRLFTNVKHISELPPEVVNRALKQPFAKRRHFVDGAFVERNEPSLHPSLQTEGIAPNKIDEHLHQKLYLPIANGIIQFCDLANPEMEKPLPDALENKVWKNLTTKGVPKFVEWLMKTLNNDATKTGLIHTLISKFEKDMEMKHSGLAVPPLASESQNPPLSDESKKTLRHCVKAIIQLAPQNLLIFAYKYFPDVKEKINERVEDALTDFLAKFTLVELLDVTISGVTATLKGEAQLDRYTNSYTFKFPTTPEEIAAHNEKKLRDRAASESRAREGLLNIVEGGIRTYRKRQWDNFVESTAEKIDKGLKDRFFGIGNFILSILNFLYEYVVLKIVNFIFSKPLESFVSFFDRLFARYIRSDIEPQIRIVSMPGVESFVNNVMTRGFEILNTTQERAAAAAENAKKSAKKADELRESIKIQRPSSSSTDLNRRASI